MISTSKFKANKGQQAITEVEFADYVNINGASKQMKFTVN